MEIVANSQRERLLLLKGLLRERLLYTMDSLFRAEITPAGRSAQKLFGPSSFDVPWTEAVDLQKRYAAVCGAIQAHEEKASDEEADSEQFAQLLLPPFPNSGGCALIALKKTYSAAKALIPPAVLVVVATYLFLNWQNNAGVVVAVAITIVIGVSTIGALIGALLGLFPREKEPIGPEDPEHPEHHRT